jgi:hypothetical protein
VEGPAEMPSVTLPADLWPAEEKKGSGLITKSILYSIILFHIFFFFLSIKGPAGSPAQTRKAAAKPAPPSPTKTHIAATPAKDLTPEQIDQQLGTKVVSPLPLSHPLTSPLFSLTLNKVVVLKNWGITTLRNEVRPKLIKMKLGINRPGLSLNGMKSNFGGNAVV